MADTKMIQHMMTVFHNSPHSFETPLYDKCVANRRNHDNGELGLWFSTTNSWQKGFGGLCYQFQIPRDNIIHISYKDFHDMCRDADSPDYFQNWRKNWMDKGHKVICIEEMEGGVDMGIVMDFDCIEQFELIESA